ncbi:MAG: hypothetical protein IPL25_12800 [Saprospiraceae bacterium]|nr:hypothetical protein [Candidatus Vicinibacter affinis]
MDADNWTTSPSQTGFTFYIPDSIRVEGNSASGNRDLCLPFDCAGRISYLPSELPEPEHPLLGLMEIMCI